MWTLDSQGAPPLWRWSGKDLGGTAAFTTRRGGVSAPPFDTLNLGRSTADRPESVAENRRRVLAALATPPPQLATAGQVHGAGLLEVEAPGHTPGYDALLTRVPGLAIAVTTADCMPLVFTAPGLVSVVHSGWRGTADGMPSVAARAMFERGAGPDRLTVHLGPCIRSCCYEVGPEVAGRFPGECVIPSGDRWRLDLPLAARLQLREAGVDDATIHDTGACTMCEPRDYFSHRRDGSPSGRQWAVAVVTAS
jgi:YfiH family protein